MSSTKLKAKCSGVRKMPSGAYAMNLRVVTWNAEGMFAPALHRTPGDSPFKSRRTRRAGTSDAIAVVRKLDADIITVPEFGIVDELPLSTRSELANMGYRLFEFPYDDEYRPPIEMAILTRLPVVSHKTYRLGEHRSVGSVVVQAGQAQLRVVAVHLDDKKESTRLSETEDLVGIANSEKRPVLMMGDFNAMHYDDWFARLVQSALFGVLVRAMPKGYLRYVLERLVEMGKGEVVAYIKRHSTLRDLDPGLSRTITAKQHGLEWIPALRLAKIDWVFASAEIAMKEYKIVSDVGSDHRPVQVTVHVT